MGHLIKYRVLVNLLNGNQGVTTFYTDSPGPLGSDQAAGEGLAASVNAFYSSLHAGISTKVSFDGEPVIETIDEVTGQPVALGSVDPWHVDGTNPGDPLPDACQLLLHLRTGVFVNGRELRGRINIPGLTEDNNDQGRLSTASVANYANLGSALIAQDPKICVWSKKHGRHEEVKTVGCWAEWAILRTRR